MRIISAPTEAAFASGRFGKRTLVKLSPDGSAPLCLWDDLGSISFSSNTYVGAAGRFLVTLPDSNADLSVAGASIEFSGLDDVVVGMVESANWSQQPARIMRAVFAIDTPQTLIVDTVFSGFMDRIDWEEGSDGKPSTLVLKLESTAREYALSGSRTASDADQRERDPNDGVFSFAANAVVRSFNWGQDPQQAPQQAPQKHGFAALLDRIF